MKNCDFELVFSLFNPEWLQLRYPSEDLESFNWEVLTERLSSIKNAVDLDWILKGLEAV